MSAQNLKFSVCLFISLADAECSLENRLSLCINALQPVWTSFANSRATNQQQKCRIATLFTRCFRFQRRTKIANSE